MNDQTLADLADVNLAINADKARIIYKAVRDYQLKRVHEDSEEYKLCDSLLDALKPYYYTQRREQPT